MMSLLDNIGRKHGTDKASTHHDYLRLYEQLIPNDRPITLMEIGWYEGASMRMWREWLHKESTVIGIDINEPKEQIPGATFFQADATNTEMLLGPWAYDGALDVVVDDGSHISSDVIATFGMLWPYVAPGGLYIVEDLEVSYHRDWGGNPNPDKPGRNGRTSMQFLKNLTDDVHWRHAGAGPDIETIEVGSVLFHPGVCVVRKRPV